MFYLDGSCGRERVFLYKKVKRLATNLNLLSVMRLPVVSYMDKPKFESSANAQMTILIIIINKFLKYFLTKNMCEESSTHPKKPLDIFEI